MRTKILWLTIWLSILLAVAACSALAIDRNAVKTEAAATIYAEQTLRAQGMTSTVSPSPVVTKPGTGTASPLVLTVTPSPSPASSGTIAPTDSPAASLTPAPSSCLPDAAFVEDVTVPDATNFSPGEAFTKTWRIRSAGCAPWPAGSAWAFDSGDQMGAPDGVPVPDTPLDGTADISVDMVAPDTPGTYKGYWQMQDASGAPFGDRVFVLIVVPGPTPTPQACPPNPALVEVINELSIQLTVEVTGPQDATFVLSANAVQRYCMMPGEYSFVARAAGYAPLTGTKTLDTGACQCWWFYSGIQVHPLCHCDSDPTHYAPLP